MYMFVDFADKLGFGFCIFGFIMFSILLIGVIFSDEYILAKIVIGIVLIPVLWLCGFMIKWMWEDRYL